MVEERYISKKGKKFGPYYYHTYRENGKVKKKYIGSKEEYTVWKKKNECSTTNWNLFLIPAILLTLFLGAFIYFNHSGISGHAVLNMQSTYLAGENISGNLNLVLKDGELLPVDTKLIVAQSSGTKEFLLSDFFNLTYGDYYAEGFNISGKGDGIGFEGEKTIYPDVYFTLVLNKIKSEMDKDKTGDELVEEEKNLEQNKTDEKEIIDEKIEENKTNNKEANENKLENKETEENKEDNKEEDKIQTEETSILEESSAQEETPVLEESSVQSSITGAVVSQDEQEVEGIVSANHSFEYDIGKDSYSIKSDSIKSEFENLSSSVLEYNLEKDILIITTNYFYNQKGFGEDYLGEANELSISLDKLNIIAENGELNISLIYGQDVFAEYNQEIIVENLTEKRANNTLNNTLGNETLIEIVGNQTLINQTGNETLKRYNIVINRPVKWQKKISTENLSEINIELPREAEDISIKTGDAIREAEIAAEQEESSIQEDKISLITGNVVLNGDEKWIFSDIWNKLIKGLTGKVTEEIQSIVETNDSKIVNVNLDNGTNEVLVEYTTPGPVANETELENGKRITITAESELNYTDILAYSYLDNRVSIENKNKIRIYHVVNDSRESISFEVSDIDNDGKIDYAEWIVPHLSEQVYEIIYITKAEHL